MTISELCDHFVQRELTHANTWRYSTKKAYKTCLKRWIIPDWGTTPLSEVRTMGVESWLRRLPLAKSSCAKLRGLFSVLFNHACRYEFFDRNPIYLVRQSAKRRRSPTFLMPAEIKALVDNLSIRERTLVFIAVSTGLRQNELFGLNWADIDFAQKMMNVTRSIVYGVVGPCKTEASQKPVPVHPTILKALIEWRRLCRYNKSDDRVFASRRHRDRTPFWGQAILRRYIRPNRAACRNSEAIRMAHVSTYLLDSPAQRGNRVQSDAGTVAAFNSAIHPGCLHPNTRASQTCSSGSDLFVGVFGRSAWNVTAVGTK
jgi:integrase